MEYDYGWIYINVEDVALRCSIKNMFLKILQNSMEVISAGVFFSNKIADLECFLLKFTKILRTYFLEITSAGFFGSRFMYLENTRNLILNIFSGYHFISLKGQLLVFIQ